MLFSQFGQVETIAAGVIDEYPDLLRPHRKMFTAFLCCLMFCIGIPLVSQVTIFSCNKSISQNRNCEKQTDVVDVDEQKVLLDGPAINSNMQSQKAVSAHLGSKQILPFGFARQN